MDQNTKRDRRCARTEMKRKREREREQVGRFLRKKERTVRSRINRWDVSQRVRRAPLLLARIRCINGSTNFHSDRNLAVTIDSRRLQCERFVEFLRSDSYGAHVLNGETREAAHVPRIAC